MIAYLSPQWIEAVAAAIAADDGLAHLSRDMRFVIAVVVDDVSYHLVADHGTVSLKAGSHDAADLVVRQDRATAVGVATGHINPGRAFLDGRIHSEGSAELLVRARPLLEALANATAAVREETSYA